MEKPKGALFSKFTEDKVQIIISLAAQKIEIRPFHIVTKYGEHEGGLKQIYKKGLRQCAKLQDFGGAVITVVPGQ